MNQTRPSQLRISWPTLERAIEIELLWDKAPSICRLLVDLAPFKSVQQHGLVTGAMLYAPTTISIVRRQNVIPFNRMALGACFFAAASQNIGLIYGDVNEPEGQSIWGQVVPQSLADLQYVGWQVWQNTIAPNGIHPGRGTKQIIPLSLDIRR